MFASDLMRFDLKKLKCSWKGKNLIMGFSPSLFYTEFVLLDFLD